MKKFLVILFSVVMVLSFGALLTACNNEKNYTVTYVYDNGQDNLVTTVAEGGTAVRPKDPEKQGFTFSGWFLDGAETEYDFTQAVNSDLTLTAHWTEKPAVEAKLTFRKYEHSSFVFDDGAAPETVYVGDTVKFRLEISPFYVGTPVVKAGSTEISKDADGYYSFTVEGDTTVSVTGLDRDDTPIEGMGTSMSPYKITNASQFKTVTDAINDTADTTYNYSYISLEADIDFKGYTIDPIGSSDYLNTVFQGVFDGNGHTISNFNLSSESNVIGLFGYLYMGEVNNLNVRADIDVELDDDFYSIGGIVGWNMGGDIYNCNYEGSITVNYSYNTYNVFVGGIAGFTQGYYPDYTSSVSYCTVDADITSAGYESVFAVGGIVGSAVGGSESAPAYVNNCVYKGDLAGNNTVAGGAVGYLREYSSVANCYASGAVNAFDYEDIAAAGGLVGLADNETAVTNSYSVSTLAADGVGSEYFVFGDVVGASYNQGLNGIDDRICLVYNAFNAEDKTVVQGGKTYDLTVWADVSELFGWAQTDWTFDGGVPKVNPEGANNIDFTVTFDFSGETVTNEAPDGSMLSQQSDPVKANVYIPVYWVYGGSGMNNFTADSGKISFGYFLDEDCTNRIPSAMMITRDMTVYVGFADYSAIGGTYYTTVHPEVADLTDTDVKLVFDDNGKMTMYFQGKIVNNMYVYDGEKVLIKGAHFGELRYGMLDGYDMVGDYYAVFDSSKGSVELYDNMFFPKQNSLFAYVKNDAMGEWYNASNDIYTFNADNTGTIARVNGTSATFTYLVTGNAVTITLSDNTVINAVISDNGTTMEDITGSAILSVKKFDEYIGAWESSFNDWFTASFDGQGTMTVDGKEYAYTVDASGNLSVVSGDLNGSCSAKFNEEGLMEFTLGEKTYVMGREGSYIGTWADTFMEYTVTFYGINKDGYGTGYDSNGVSFTYVSEKETLGTESVGIYMYYQTTVYGFGSFQKFKSDYAHMGEGTLALAVADASGMINDDYSLCYEDAIKGVWNGENGMTLDFNGFGAYKVEINLSTGKWICKGEVTVSEGNEKTTVFYDYDRTTGKATFTYKEKNYTVVVKNNQAITVTEGDVSVDYLVPDVYSGFTYTGEGTTLSFNGKSNVGLGKVTVTTSSGATEYDYTVDELNVATLTLNGETAATVRVNEEISLLELKWTDETTVNLGLYNMLAGKTYISNSDSLTIGEVFDLNSMGEGKLNDSEIELLYVTENSVAVLSGGTLSMYLVYVNENNVAVYDGSGSLVNVLCVADGLGGTYTSAAGETLVLDGRSLNVQYYAYATYTDAEQNKIVYVYMTDEEGTSVYLLDRSGGETKLIKVYNIYTEEKDGATAFTSESGKTVWLESVE